MATLYDTCGDLFGSYPLAADGADGIQDMVLMLEDQFFILTRVISRDASPYYQAHCWHGDPLEDIQIGAHDTELSVPREIIRAITCGTPLPRHGSVFGWADGETVTALITFHTMATPEQPEPAWSVMPHAGMPVYQWPPFAGERLFSRSRFWDYCRAGNIESLAGLIAASPRTFFWVDAQAVLDASCCAVARDAVAPEGWMVPQGRYVYIEALQAGKPAPPLSALLADPSAIDLAARFRFAEVSP